MTIPQTRNDYSCCSRHTRSQHLLEPVPEEEGDGHGLPHLVGSGAGAGGEGATQLVQHPGLGRREALQVLLGTARHLEAGKITSNLKGRH